MENQRINRALQQKIYLLSHDGVRFEIMGTTSNYTVDLNVDGRHHTCTCPDFTQREKNCKHIYFCLFRVLSIKVSEWTTRSAKKKIEDFLEKKTELFSSENHKESSDCPICYEEYEQKSRKTFCDTCGNGFHSECIIKWISRSSGNTCPLCRSVLLVQSMKRKKV